MGDITVKNKTGLIDVLHSRGKGTELQKPFEREILLFDTNVAGTTHVVGIEDIMTTLNVGDKLSFFREPDNAYDKQAIMVTTAEEIKIGYVPQKDNIIFARLMDAGKLLYGRVTEKEMRGKWAKIKMNIFLQE